MEFEEEEGTKQNKNSDRLLHIPVANVKDEIDKIPTFDSRKSVMINKGRCPSELGSARNQSLVFGSNSSYPAPIQNKRNTIYEPLQSKMLDPYVQNTRNESKAV